MPSGDAKYSPVPNRPLTALELQRIAVALQALGTKKSNQVWLVMCGDPPEVVTAADSPAAALKLSQQAQKDQTGPCDVYGPYDTRTATVYSSALMPTGHDQMTQSYALSLVAGVTTDLPDLDDVTSITLEITARSGTWKYAVRPGTDAIFLTQWSREAFVYPRYHTLFGTNYEDALRERFSEPR
jgi:hypothetical protein